MVKLLKKQAEVVSLEAIGEHQIRELIEARVREADMQIEPQAVNALLQRTGSDLSLIMSELPNSR